ncbi:MAG: hypothetical protein ACI89U_003287, partial [Gammaproteobacteria bacterium]
EKRVIAFITNGIAIRFALQGKCQHVYVCVRSEEPEFDFRG